MRLLHLLAFIVFLMPISVLGQTPSSNNTIELIRNAVKYKSEKHPNNTYKYSCIEFRKMQFQDIDSISKFTSESNIENTALIESFTGIKHIIPDKTLKSQISGNLIGKIDLIHTILFEQINPFNLYNDTIRLLNLKLINPISNVGINYYQFQIIDTLFTGNDTLIHIAFKPNSLGAKNGFEGRCHLHKSTGAVQSIALNSVANDTENRLSITQNYAYVDGKIWFPEVMECHFSFLSTSTKQRLNVQAKSQITAVVLNPLFDESIFLVNPSEKQQSPKYYHPKLSSPIDSASYYLLDSLEKKQQLDKLTSMQTLLIDGYLNAGYLKVDYRKLIDYNDYEGLKLGLGLWTSEKVSKTFETGGYFVRSLRRDENKVGAGFNYFINKELDAKAELSWYDDFDETGTIEFLDGYKKYSSEAFRKFLTESMDRAVSYKIKLQTCVLTDFKVAAFAQHKDVAPDLNYRFVSDSTFIQSPYNIFETGLKLRWTHNQTNTNKTKWPVIWGNTSFGTGDGIAHYQFVKNELQVQQSFNVSSSSTTTIRFNSGLISGTFPTSILYSAFGSYKPLGLEIPYTFGTMRLNEFAADRFGAIYLNHEIQLLKNSKGKFKPQVIFTTNIGKGDVANSNFAGKTYTFKKGFYESGIVLNNLYSILLIDYGLSIHYRYGYYHLPNESANWALKFSIKFNID